MKLSDFVVCLIHASGGSIRGRTLLQKRAFFVGLICGLEEELGFAAHYYGPFSPAIDSVLTQLKTLGFVDEITIGFGAVGSEGFEVKRYDYRLTEDGTKIAESIRTKKREFYDAIMDAIRRLVRGGDPNYFELSIAAKAYYILHSKGKAMTTGEIVREAQSFDWKISNPSLQRAVSFLESLELVQTS